MINQNGSSGWPTCSGNDDITEVNESEERQHHAPVPK